MTENTGLSKIDENNAEEAAPEEAPKMSVVQASALQVSQQEYVVRFRNRPMVLLRDPFPHFTPLHKERFDAIAYPLLGGVTRSRISDVFAYVSNMAEDLSHNDNLVLFGLEDPSDGAYADMGYYHRDARSLIWDAEQVEWVERDANQAIWRSPYGAIDKDVPVPFVMSLAGNNQGVYDDIMQSIAPMIMQRKPDGVIWWVGDGANGKSTLMDALYKIFPGQLASITVKNLTEAKDTPFLNGNLANIVKESSEGRIDDTEIYKAVGTHEDFKTHKFHSQEMITVRGNLHHIFSANSIPTFSDKGFSARRRTFIVPFNQRFESDPTFEERTFNAQMFGHLIWEMTKYAKRLKDQGYRYKWSAITMAAKTNYDTDANNAEEYAQHIIDEGVVAFDSFNPVKMDYENWCADEGYVPLGITNLRRALNGYGFERLTVRETADYTKKMYRLPVADKPGELQQLGMGRPGMYTIPGFKKKEKVEPVVPEFEQPNEPPAEPEKKKTIIGDKW